MNEVEQYKLEQGPARELFDSYSTKVTLEWVELLSTGPTEREIQSFLELHPSMVPGARTPGSPSGHGPLYQALITQPRLPGFHSRIPDFMWIATHSAIWYPTLIEIEDPSKRLFTKSGQQTAEFSQAKNQLDRWRTWFSNPTNLQVFMDEYGIPTSWRQSRTCELHMILIFGRRTEFEDNPELSKLRSCLMPNDSQLMSYDRLSLDPNLQLTITVRPLGNGRFQAVRVPETYGIIPVRTANLEVISDIGQAIDTNSAVSSERKAFLQRRIDYWLNVGPPKVGSSEFMRIIE